MRDYAMEMYLVHNKGLAISLRAHLSCSFIKPGVDKKVSRPGPGCRSGFAVWTFPAELQKRSASDYGRTSPHRHGLTNRLLRYRVQRTSRPAPARRTGGADDIVPSVPIHTLMAFSSSRRL